MKDECLICGAELEYSDVDTVMECALCHKKEHTKTKCKKGHFICNDCHTSGVDRIVKKCLEEKSKNPVKILESMMAMDFCHMHGPEHHILVGASLLTAYKNAGGSIDLPTALGEMLSRGRQVPGGACGFWGACGAAVSSGIFMSIVTGATPLSTNEWGMTNLMTSASLSAIGTVGGPRCCKRNSYLAIQEATKFIKENLGVELEAEDITCTYSDRNNQCIGERCPFNKGAVSDE